MDAAACAAAARRPGADPSGRGPTTLNPSLQRLLSQCGLGRTFVRGHTRLTCPLRVCVGASNRLPEDEQLAAFADRFLVRAFVEPIGDSGLEELLSAGWSLRGEESLSGAPAMEHVDRLSAVALAMDLRPVRTALAHAVRLLRSAGIDFRAELAAQGARAPEPCLAEQRLISGLGAIRQAIELLDTPFAPAQPAGVYRSAAAAPGAEIARYTAPLLALATLVGLAFGAAGVAVDRSAGVMAKLREIWAYRELIVNLVLRDMRVRYKGSALGYLWTQLAPLLLMLVFWFVFSRLLSSSISMFPVFLIIGLLVWNFCNEAVVGGARSVLDNANLIKKVFFPREVLPLVSVLASLLNFVLSLPMMFVLMALVQLGTLGRLNFAWTIAYLPVLLIIQSILLAGLALLMSALAVRFRDFVHLIGILMQFWFFLTPVVYAIDSFNTTVLGVPLAQALRWLNPMASLIEFYREILYGQAVSAPNVPTPGLPALTSVLRVLVTAVSILAAGYWFFQRRSGSFGEDI
jgi:lipopolysaccharide transport system permease protein